MSILVYIAGPYRAKTISGVRRNIDAAREAAERVWSLGIPCICPHLNTAFMDGIVDDQVFLDGDLEILKRCDVVLALPYWMDSKGASAEVNYAHAQHKKVCLNVDELARWIVLQNRKGNASG